jgi:glycosyltransferase involved in cell wall biosynthesis
VRLGLFIDAAFRRERTPDGMRLFRGPGDFGFMHFAAAVGAHFGELRVIARESDDAAECPNPLPSGLDLIPLPYYPSLRRVGSVARTMPRTIAALWHALAEVDAVWITGVHPLGLALALMALLRRKRVVLLIRQDSPRYFKHRVAGSTGALVRPFVWFLDFAFRALARRCPTTVVGAEVARRYGATRPNLLEMHINLLREADLVDRPSSADWSERIEVLTVGRIDREKNPLLVPNVLEELERGQAGRFRLTWVGEGPMAGLVAEEASRRGVGGLLELPGYVPFGPALLEHYRAAHCFVHIALTEGVPQVLYEAMGSGLPVIATDVGGVSDALERGRAGVLVPPDDAHAVAAAILRFANEPELRRSLAERGLELARRVTIESESERVAAFIRSGVV